MALRPEEVEEEAGAEDGGYGDADEDVVGCDADVGVVVDMDWVLGAVLYAVLLVDVVCERVTVLVFVMCAWGGGERMMVPDSAAVPTDSETTIKIMAHW